MSVSVSATVTASATEDLNAKVAARSKQHRNDQIIQFTAFLDTYTQDGSPLPGHNGKPSVSVLLVAAGLPRSLDLSCSTFRTTAEKYASKVGYTRPTEFRAKLVASMPTALPHATGMTYQQLFDLDATTLKLKHTKSLASYHSALERLMKLVDKTHTDPTGAELAGEFEQMLQKFAQTYYDGDNQKAKSARSCLNKYQQVVAAQQCSDGLPTALDAALTLLVQKDGRSARDLSKAVGQSPGFVADLMAGRQRAAPSEVLTYLEEVLGVGAGILTLRAVHSNPRHRPDFCSLALFPEEFQGPEKSLKNMRASVRKHLPDNFPSRSETEQRQIFADVLDDVLNKRYLSEYGRILSTARENPYVLKAEQTTPRLREEINDFCRMKYGRGSMGRGKKSKDKIWRPKRGGKVGSEDRWRKTMNMFFGWCLLSVDASDPMLQGAGMAPADLTLGLILIPDLIDGYVQFRKVRAGGKDTQTCDMFLTDSLSMLQAGHGWVEGHPELLYCMPDAFQDQLKETNSTWQAQCAQQFSFFTQIKDELDIEVSRESFEPIQALIDTGRPMDLVQRALDYNWKELQVLLQRNDLTARQKAEMYRDHLLISMLAALPLRASHWYGMTYRTNARNLNSRNDGELRHVDGKHWALYLRAGDFKNSKNKAIFGANADRDLALLFHESQKAFADLEPLLDKYMQVYRPLLCPGNGPVFPSIHGMALTGDELRKIVYRWTQHYLSEHGDHKYGLCILGVKPFGPHAFRHLMASHILKTTGKVEDAANMLLDSIEMIIQHYGHFLPSDRLSMTFGRLDISRANRTDI